MASITEEQVDQKIRVAVDKALAQLSDAIVYEIGKLHVVTGQTLSRAVSDGVFIVRRNLK